MRCIILMSQVLRETPLEKHPKIWEGIWKKNHGFRLYIDTSPKICLGTNGQQFWWVARYSCSDGVSTVLSGSSNDGAIVHGVTGILSYPSSCLQSDDWGKTMAFSTIYIVESGSTERPRLLHTAWCQARRSAIGAWDLNELALAIERGKLQHPWGRYLGAISPPRPKMPLENTTSYWVSGSEMKNWSGDHSRDP